LVCVGWVGWVRRGLVVLVWIGRVRGKEGWVSYVGEGHGMEGMYERKVRKGWDLYVRIGQFRIGSVWLVLVG